MAARSVALLAVLCAGCSFHAPVYPWHRPGASLVLSEQDRAALKVDEDTCTQERDHSALRLFSGAAWYDATQQSYFKDCMEARGWTKEPQ